MKWWLNLQREAEQMHTKLARKLTAMKTVNNEKKRETKK